MLGTWSSKKFFFHYPDDNLSSSSPENQEEFKHLKDCFAVPINWNWLRYWLIYMAVLTSQKRNSCRNWDLQENVADFFPLMLECYIGYHFIWDAFFSIFHRVILCRAKYQCSQKWCKPVKRAGFHIAELWNFQGWFWPLFPCLLSFLTHSCVSWRSLLVPQQPVNAINWWKA